MNKLMCFLLLAMASFNANAELAKFDQSAPVFLGITPLYGAVVTEALPLVIDAIDNVAVTKIEAYTTGTNRIVLWRGFSLSAHVQTTVKDLGLKPGQNIVTFIAYDISGNKLAVDMVYYF